MRSAPPISLKGRALRLLSGREYSRFELERKLAQYEEAAGTLAQALDELQAKGFISEQRVVESVLNRRAAKLGTARIRHELQSKGVQAHAVQEAVDQLRASELDRARAVWRKKFGSQPQSPSERGKQVRFMASRGFTGETIQKVVAGDPDE